MKARALGLYAIAIYAFPHHVAHRVLAAWKGFSPIEAAILLTTALPRDQEQLL